MIWQSKKVGRGFHMRESHWLKKRKTKLTETHNKTHTHSKSNQGWWQTHSYTWTDKGIKWCFTWIPGTGSAATTELSYVSIRRCLNQTYLWGWQTKWLPNLFPFGVEVSGPSEALGSYWSKEILGNWNISSCALSRIPVTTSLFLSPGALRPLVFQGLVSEVLVVLPEIL